MNVNELFRRLSFKELSNLSIGGEGSGVIAETAKPRLIAYTNEALLRLYSRFVLKENDLLLQLSDFITNYHLSGKFAQSNEDPCPGDTLYIVDHAGDPFRDDVIRVLTVGNGIGEPFILNDRENPLSLFTPQPNVLQVPNPIQDQILSVTYQARHPELKYDDMDACIELPVTLEGALSAYIAHQVFHHMNGVENSQKAAEYLTLYDNICAEIIDKDLVNSSMSTGRKFNDRGFV